MEDKRGKGGLKQAAHATKKCWTDLSISKPYQLSSTDPRAVNSWLISKNPYQQSIDDKKLIVDKVVLINKEP
jgi:hypothetical protein